MKITDDTWELRCESVAQKQELFDYAAERGLKANEVFRNDEHLALGTIGRRFTLISYPGCAIESYYKQIAPADFRRMCDEYATANGVPA